MANGKNEACTGKKSDLSIRREQQILEAAEEAFSSYGYHGAEMDRIAEMAGVSKGTIYYYFEDKKSLFLKTLANGLESVLARIRDSLKNCQGPVEKLQIAMETYLTYFEDHERLYQIIYQHRSLFKEAFKPDQHKKFLPHIELFQEIITEGTGQNKFRKIEPSLAAWSVVGVMHAAIHRWMVTGCRQNLNRDLSFIREFIFNGITNDENAAKSGGTEN